MKTKMQTLPPKPLASDFVAINLPSPVGDKEYKMEMQTLLGNIVDVMMAHPDDKQQARAPMRKQLNLIMAMQAHGLDGNGPFLR